MLFRSYFENLPQLQVDGPNDLSHATVRDHFLLLAKNQSRVVPASASSVSAQHERKQFAVGELINAYRRRGHLKANLDPLGMAEKQAVPSLELAFHGLSQADIDTRFQVGSLRMQEAEASLAAIINVLEGTYCGAIGAEFMHITDQIEQSWVQERDRKSTRLNSSHSQQSRMPSSA